MQYQCDPVRTVRPSANAALESCLPPAQPETTQAMSRLGPTYGAWRACSRPLRAGRGAGAPSLDTLGIQVVSDKQCTRMTVYSIIERGRESCSASLLFSTCACLLGFVEGGLSVVVAITRSRNPPHTRSPPAHPPTTRHDHPRLPPDTHHLPVQWSTSPAPSSTARSSHQKASRRGMYTRSCRTS